MEKSAQPYDRIRYENETAFHQVFVRDAIKLGERLATDPDRRERLRELKCPWCYYRGRGMACAAMTKKPCDICEKEMHFGSSATDAVCPGCAKEHGICCHCGADLDLKIRRKAFRE